MNFGVTLLAIIQLLSIPMEVIGIIIGIVFLVKGNKDGKNNVLKGILAICIPIVIFITSVIISSFITVIH